jgi:hypothetical protein
MAPYQNIPNQYRAALNPRGAMSRYPGGRSAYGAKSWYAPPGDGVSSIPGTSGPTVPTPYVADPWRPSYPRQSPWGSSGEWGSDGYTSPFQNLPHFSYGQVNRAPLWGTSVSNPNPPWWNPGQVTGTVGPGGGPVPGSPLPSQQISPLQNPLYNQGYGSLFDWGAMVPNRSAFYSPSRSGQGRNIPAGMEHWFPEEGYANPFTGSSEATSEDIYGIDEDEYLSDDLSLDVPLPEGRKWTLQQMESLLEDLSRNQYNRNLFRPSLGWSEYFPGSERVQEAGIFHERPGGWSPVPGFEENLYTPHFGTQSGPVDPATGQPIEHSGWLTPGAMGETLFGKEPDSRFSTGVRDPRLQYWQSQWMPKMDTGPAGGPGDYLSEILSGDYSVPNYSPNVSVFTIAEQGLPEKNGKEFDFDSDFMDDWGPSGRGIGNYNEEFNNHEWGNGLSAELRGANGDGLDSDGNPYTEDESPRDAFMRNFDTLQSGGELTPGQNTFMYKWLHRLGDPTMPDKWAKKWQKYLPQEEFDWLGTGINQRTDRSSSPVPGFDDFLDFIGEDEGPMTDYQWDQWDVITPQGNKASKEFLKKPLDSEGNRYGKSPRENVEEVLKRLAEGKDISTPTANASGNVVDDRLDSDVGLLSYWIPLLARASDQQRGYWGKPHEWKRYGTSRGEDDVHRAGSGYSGYQSNVNAWGAPLRRGPLTNDIRFEEPSWNRGQPQGEIFTPQSWVDLEYGFSPFEHGGYGSKMWGARRSLPSSKAAMEYGVSGAYPHYQSVPYLSQPSRYQNPAFYRQGYAAGGLVPEGESIGSEVIDFAERHESRNGGASSEIYGLINKLRDAILNPSKESDSIIRAFKNAFGEEEYESFIEKLLISEGISSGNMMGAGMPVDRGSEAIPGGDMLSAVMSMGQGEPAEQYQYGGMISGPGDGLSDSVQSSIDGQEPVMLSDGEYVIPAGIVSALGNGSSDAGGKVLDGMIQRVGANGESHKVPGKPIDLGRVLPR